jgi:putative membrane protein
MTAVVALHVLPPAVFALLHGTRLYGWRGILVFVSICIVVGNIFENLGVRTGFPYGRYYFTDLMGPKLGVVPVLLGLAYIGMAYLSWTLARIILGQPQGPLRGSRAILVPLSAACIMVSWDVSQDPVWATVLHAWVFPQGGPYFGVPVSNFAGWYLTISIINLLFALYLRIGATSARELPPSYWREALFFYTASAAGNLLLVVPRKDIPAVVYAGGTPWNVHAITAACAVVTVFTMGTFALLGWARLPDCARAVNLDPDRAYQWGRENPNK